MKTIEVIVSPEGKADVQTRGFLGLSCRESSRFLEQSLGIRLGENVTAEFHQSEQTQRSERQRA